MVARSGGGGGGARAPRSLGVRRRDPRAGAASQEDAARSAPPVADVPLPTSQYTLYIFILKLDEMKMRAR